ncbi:trehalose-phosphatase, partial [Janibacter sp. RAF20_2_2]
GKGVHELSVLRADKGTALRALATTLGVDASVYLGDDVTDEHAFAVLGPHDLGIKVGAGETAARARIDACTDVPEVLALLARRRG